MLGRLLQADENRNSLTSEDKFSIRIIIIHDMYHGGILAGNLTAQR